MDGYHALRVLYYAATMCSQNPYQQPHQLLVWWRRIRQMKTLKAQILRDIFGNPFRPITFDPSWRTSTVVSLAQQMYESRDFSAMPILADALADAGCSNEAILQHCRGPGPHVRGCFVVDLLIEKE